jgi:hypothetical protein
VDSSAFGLKGQKKIAIIREIGTIVGGGSSKGESGRITSKSVIKKLRSVAKQKDIAAVVLRVDSPGVILCMQGVVSAHAQYLDKVAIMPCATFRPCGSRSPALNIGEKMYLLMSEGIGVVDRWQYSRHA